MKRKLELAGRTPLFNYGGQEILIQQLQDEIERLTKKYSGSFTFQLK